MNYQRACRSGGCYQGMGAMQRMAPGYNKQENDYSPYGRTGSYHGGKTQTDIRLPVATSLAMVYSPIQYWRDIYDVDFALERGTLFAELDKPLCSAGK